MSANLLFLKSGLLRRGYQPQFVPVMLRSRTIPYQEFEDFRGWVEGRHVFAKRPECPSHCQKLKKKTQVKYSQDLGIFVKSTSGSAKIWNFKFFGIIGQLLATNSSKTPKKKQKFRISVLPDVDFTKIPKS